MFESLSSLDADPILGLMADYRADGNPQKIHRTVNGELGMH